jgi:hypothetical protein
VRPDPDVRALAGGGSLLELARGVFRMLDQQTTRSGGGRLPEWQATHPDPGNRIQATEQRLAALNENLDAKRVGRRVPGVTDGMVYGDPRRDSSGALFSCTRIWFQFQSDTEDSERRCGPA